MKEIKDNARDLMKGFCRVCPECNGKACAGEVPGMGGLGTGSSFKNNITALQKVTLNMRCLHDVTDPDTGLSFLGYDLSLPVLAAPIGGVSFNMGGAVSEEEYIASKLLACDKEGILGCTGDGVPPVIYESGFKAIEKVKGRGIPFIKPWEDEELFAKMDAAAETGAKVMGMDIDAAGLITLRKMGRPVSPKSGKKLAQIVKRTEMKFILKGVMTPDEAQLAIDCGVDAVVVSNHGGRVLDHCPGTADVLPEIAKKVAGQVPVLVDGGVRTGSDVLKMLALGADLVLIGRPFSIAVLGGLQDGAAALIQKIRSELVQSMVLTGTQNLAAISQDIIFSS